MNELFLKIINMSISASWLVLAVLLLRFVLKKAPKWVNVLLWGIVAVRLAFPFSIESALSLIPSAETIPPNIGMNTTPTINSGINAINNAVNVHQNTRQASHIPKYSSNSGIFHNHYVSEKVYHVAFLSPTLHLCFFHHVLPGGDFSVLYD